MTIEHVCRNKLKNNNIILNLTEKYKKVELDCGSENAVKGNERALQRTDYMRKTE